MEEGRKKLLMRIGFGVVVAGVVGLLIWFIRNLNKGDSPKDEDQLTGEDDITEALARHFQVEPGPPLPAPTPVDCQLSDWTPFDTCTKKSDGRFSHTRSRTIVTQPKNGGAPCGPLTQSESCVPPDGTPCESNVAGRMNHYMNGQCVFNKCADNFTMVNNVCIPNNWYLPGGVGPHYLKYKSKKPSALCQANGEWYNLGSEYFDNSLNCPGPKCTDDGKINFCFKRTDENHCNGTASGYYGNGRDDRVKDCVWVPSLQSNKIFNTEQEYINASTV